MTTDNSDDRAIMRHAIGRLLRMLSRPFEPGDREMYEAVRSLILDTDDGRTRPDYRVCYVRDRLRGAQGDAT